MKTSWNMISSHHFDINCSAEWFTTGQPKHSCHRGSQWVQILQQHHCHPQTGAWMCRSSSSVKNTGAVELHAKTPERMHLPCEALCSAVTTFRGSWQMWRELPSLRSDLSTICDAFRAILVHVCVSCDISALFSVCRMPPAESERNLWGCNATLNALHLSVFCPLCLCQSISVNISLISKTFLLVLWHFTLHAITGQLVNELMQLYANIYILHNGPTYLQLYSISHISPAVIMRHIVGAANGELI